MSETEVEEDLKLHDGIKVKPGVRQMISQAWDRHRRDQVAVSVNKHQVKEILIAEWEREMRGHMNEAFTLELDLTPFVTEVYTDTEPIARAAQRVGLIAGQSLTLGSGWDFKDSRHREAAIKLIKKIKPFSLIIAFPCGVWSPLQNLSPGLDLEARRVEAKDLVIFALTLAKLQMAGKRHFLIENPLPSAAWRLPEVQEFMMKSSVLSVVIDMCRFNLRGPDGLLRKKATRLLTSSQVLVSQMMNCRCLGGHMHCPVIGGSKITAAAGHYTREFADAVIAAFMDQYDSELQFDQAEPSCSEVLVGEHVVSARKDSLRKIGFQHRCHHLVKLANNCI